MASAFIGEISAIIELVTVREIKAAMGNGIKIYEGGNKFDWWSWPISEDYFRIYKTNVDKIGLFEVPLPSHIARFYTVCFAVAEDLKTLGEPQKLNNPTFMVHVLRQDIAILDRAEKLGREIVAELSKVSVSDPTFPPAY